MFIQSTLATSLQKFPIFFPPMYALGLLKLPVDAQAKEIMLFCIVHCTERGGQKLSHETGYRFQFPIRKLLPDPDPNGQSIPVLIVVIDAQRYTLSWDS